MHSKTAIRRSAPPHEAPWTKSLRRIADRKTNVACRVTAELWGWRWGLMDCKPRSPDGKRDS
jgi:hypothetical protein